jgi:hypothetical protein
VIECLSRAISSSNSIIGLKLADLSLKHLLYADDLLNNSNGIDDLHCALVTLDMFCNATALENNKSKSKLILIFSHCCVKVYLTAFKACLTGRKLD